MISKKYLDNLIVFAKRLLFFLILMTVSRLVFLFYNLKTFSPISVAEVLRSVFFGMRFDFVMIYYLNILFILIHLFAFPLNGRKWYEVSLKTIFVSTAGVLLLANVIDAGYFGFTNKRSGWEMLDMLASSPDTASLLPSYIKNYWPLSIIWLGFMEILIHFYPRYKVSKVRLPKIKNLYTYFLWPACSLLLLGIGFGIARGIDSKPVRIISANKYVSPKYVPLLLNTPFKIVNTLNQYSIPDRTYFPYSELSSIYSPVQQYSSETGFSEKNVVIILLESFGKEYVEYTENGISYTPFLDSLKQEGLYFENAFANAFRSMDALPAVVSGFPSMMSTAYINSAYSVNEISGLAPILRFEKGYKTAFFHGGQNGTMGFNDFCKAASIEEYHGKTEFNNNDYFDGKWGIFDEEFFSYMIDRIDEYDKPFLSILFSLSSHDPYPIPEKYKGKFPKGELPILECVAYTDYSLRKMFEKASTTDWYENTLFVFCADHTSIAIQNEYKSRLGRVRIPVLYYAPGDTSLRMQSKSVSQHLDITPSVLDYIGYNKPFVSYGQSVFREGYKFSVNYDEINYQIIDSTHALLFDGENSIGLFNYVENPMMNTNILSKYSEKAESLETLLKAYLQDYNYRMNNNLLAQPVEIEVDDSRVASKF